MKNFCIYIILCADDTYYIGMTSNIEKRIERHNSAYYPNSYTSYRLPVVLVYVENHPNFWSTMRREKQIKNWSRAKKEALINGEMNSLSAKSKKVFKK